MSKKIVVKLDLHDNKEKQKAFKAVAALVGIDELSIDMASQKMTVIGMVDPVNVVSKLRKSWAASIDSVGSAKVSEQEKKDGDGKKDGDSKKDGEGDKKDGDGGKEEGKKDGEKKATDQQQMIAELISQSRAYYNPYMPSHYVMQQQQQQQSMEENPNSCAIC